jgi:putative ABC transport system ATP-binding protein
MIPVAAPVPEIIRLEGITKGFRIGVLDMMILNGIDLVITRGECTAIIGTSGGGKSTLMNIIGLLDEPTGGRYLLEGENVLNIDDDHLSEIRASRLGFVFQQFNLLPRLTAVENVALPLVYRGIGKREGEARALALLEKVGMKDRAWHRPTELSGGQQQRVAVARALVGNPSLLLADEPTGALDTRVSQEIMDLFLQLNREDGITLVIITHDMKIASQCRRQIRIKDGLILDEPAARPGAARLATAAAGGGACS